MVYKGTKKYSTPDLIIELIEFAKKLGRFPQTREFGSGKAVHLTRRFGKWIYILEHCGLWPSKEDLEFYYIKNKLSCNTIKDFFKPLTKHTIRNLCVRYGFKMRKSTDYKAPSGPESVHWKGGRTIGDGYVYLTIDGVRRGEHRIVMEKVLGRTLKKSEHIHHLNGIRGDNRLENLVVMEKSEHHKEGRTLAKHQAKRIRELENLLKIHHTP